MRRGDSGQHVKELQGLLNSKIGRRRLAPDGHFGEMTEKVLTDFQRLAHLQPDGVAGPLTLRAS
ncbi:peptidoglycan-binding domain-containing protein [uncultured Thiodictyon sp.]|uniref:peptidoglycan-binding domain-containing protein n=1 Tax=uncultured Thiodictyon sp. TaxID=1846217 RepID=UPI003459CBDA